MLLLRRKSTYPSCSDFPNQEVTLLYLYWEPANHESSPEFAMHREETDVAPKI